jgi:hypothetical protein
MPKVIKQEWVEVEEGWGIKPCGCSLHLTRDDCERYIEARRHLFAAPEKKDYSCPAMGEPDEIEVDEHTYERIKAAANRHGIWDDDL